MPVAQLIVESVVLLLEEELAKSYPTTAECLGRILHATLLLELLGHIVIGLTFLLQLDEAGIVGVVIECQLLRDSRGAAWDTAGVGRLPSLRWLISSILYLSD